MMMMYECVMLSLLLQMGVYSIPLIMLVDVRQYCCLLTFVCLPLFLVVALGE